MSGDEKEMQSATDVTHARILNRLFDIESKDLHTEINAPFGMSTFDTVIPFAKEEFGDEYAELLGKWGDRFRINMIAHRRQRAKEIIEGVKAELAREERELRDRLVGQIGR